jgi:hypothetical protein
MHVNVTYLLHLSVTEHDTPGSPVVESGAQEPLVMTSERYAGFLVSYATGGRIKAAERETGAPQYIT